MFLPSKVQLPLSMPTKDYAAMTGCEVCDSYFICSNSNNMADKSVTNNTYRLYKHEEEYKLEYVCENCRRWVRCNLWKISLGYQDKGYFGYITTATKEGWQQVKKDLFSKYPIHIARYIYDWMRKQRYNILTAYNWESYFSSGEVSFIWEQLRELTKDEGCVDNYRAARVGNKRQMKRYKEAKDSGCCGSVDKDIGGIMIGCNYGH